MRMVYLEKEVLLAIAHSRSFWLELVAPTTLAVVSAQVSGEEDFASR